MNKPVISEERLDKLLERVRVYKEHGEEEMRMGVDEMEIILSLAKEKLKHKCPQCYRSHSGDDDNRTRWHD
jgi:hypothetical protein